MPAPITHDLPLSLIQEAVVTMLADCFTDPNDSGKAHAKAMRESPERLAGYLISEANRMGGSETPDSQEASEAVTVDQEKAKRARWTMQDLTPAERTGLDRAMTLLGLDPVEFHLDLTYL